MFKEGGAKTAKEYFSSLEEPRRSEIEKLDRFITKVTGSKPSMEKGMLGYIKYDYRSGSGREGIWYVVLLASQKNYISVYVCGVDDKGYVAERYKGKLKASIGKSCIRFKKIEDVDFKILEEVIREAMKSPMGKVKSD